jgi:DNA-binding MarR family transcriptional regulator
MQKSSLPRSESTPAGRLEEARLHHILGYQLAQAAIATAGVFAQQVGEPFGLRPVEFTILSLVDENPGSSLSRLAQALAVSAPNITMWIDRLEERGLVQRERSETDRRAQHLGVTAKGRQLVAKATQRLLDAEREQFGHLSDAERAILVELLHKLACSRPSGREAAAGAEPVAAARPRRAARRVP